MNISWRSSSRRLFLILALNLERKVKKKSACQVLFLKFMWLTRQVWDPPFTNLRQRGVSSPQSSGFEQVTEKRVGAQYTNKIIYNILYSKVYSSPQSSGFEQVTAKWVDAQNAELSVSQFLFFMKKVYMRMLNILSIALAHSCAIFLFYLVGEI